jgi:ATP-dependent RNA helicase RhlE
MNFTELNLEEELLRTLNKKHYDEPTSIQEKSIPVILAGKDVFGCAATGTGKTAAFALPVLQLLKGQNTTNRKDIRVLALAPTRELALQIFQSFTEYGAGLNLKTACVFGGVSQVPQLSMIRRGVDILVATPGRLLDLMQQGHISLNKLSILILDEADRMLDMGFIGDIRRVIAKTPVNRQTLFFSATSTPEVNKLSESMLRNPVRINIALPLGEKKLVKEQVYMVKREDKRKLLVHLLGNSAVDQALVFTRTKRGADHVTKDLLKKGISAEAIHGNKSQNAREKALNAFKRKTVSVLVATDVASRGIDIVKLSHVINYEMPGDADTYTHRIGRTGRAGLTGSAFSLCSADEMPLLKIIQKSIKKNLSIASHPFAC